LEITNKRYKEMNNIKQYHKIFLDIAESISAMSNCVSHKVGAILVKDKRIISTGYNGTPKGFWNCNEINGELDVTKPEDRAIHHAFSEKFEIHAECNVMLCAARNGICIEGSVLYTTLHPCYDCLKMICNSGIKTIIYRYEYDKFNNDENIDEMLESTGVTLLCEKELQTVLCDKDFL
jgi:dCMP deaminase